MTILAEPKPEFRHLSETEIEKALAHHDPQNPIAVEVARLVEVYTVNFQAHVERLGRIPASILHVMPQWPIEAVAMRLTTEAIPNPRLAYVDPHWPERPCDHCSKPYRGPAVYCSLQCAQADA